MYVLEYINNCCFTHGEPNIYGKYATQQEAINAAKALELLTMDDMGRQGTYATQIRILDLGNYPNYIYHSSMDQYLYELTGDQVPDWSVGPSEDEDK